jgi:class 3 adenylate cyclase
MASFDEVPAALACALEIQRAFGQRIASGGQPAYRVRIGMAAGEPVDHNDDLFGPTVNLASRLTDSANPGEILVSAAIEEAAGEEFVFERRDPVLLKGFAETVPAFRLVGQAPG